jgi:hypothetical protein
MSRGADKTCQQMPYSCHGEAEVFRKLLILKNCDRIIPENLFLRISISFRKKI